MKTLFHMAISLTGLASAAAAPPKVPAHGCPPAFLERFDAGPTQAGPLQLSLISCVDFQSSPVTFNDPIMSPDGRSLARWDGGLAAPIEIAALDKPGRVSVPNRVSAPFRNYAALGDALGTAPDAVAWRTDSRAVFSVRQEIIAPGGWALSGLVPVSIGSDGTMLDLPRLRHPAGPLDGLIWVGGKGLALAQFGTRGGYYRPEHEDSKPTLAMVDAARGRVLAFVPALSVPSLRARVHAHGLMVGGATATILSDGRIRAVVQFGRWAQRPPGTVAGKNFEPIMHPGVWLVWTQGEAPREWTAPYADSHSNPLALSPDGSKLLVVRRLQPEGMQISCRIPCRGPPPPPPTPVSGPVAELIDIASRRVLWRIPARAVQFWRQSAAPAISGDGRYALVEVPPDGDRAPIALIDMRNGRLVQTIAPSHTYSYAQSFGFSGDGRRVWVAVGNQVLVYALNRR